MFMDILLDTIHDTYLMLPLLFIAYMVIEYFERRDSNDDKLFLSLQKYGPLVGALVGVIPQCGFSIIAAMLFMGNNITLGTLVAVFIATSDEAIPILLANPSLYTSLISILIFKVGLGIVAGYLIDFVFFKKQKIQYFADMPDEDDEDYEENDDEAIVDNSCPCCYTQYPMPVSALLRSIKIFIFLFITAFLLTALITYIGEETLETLLLNNTIFQPIIAALFGFIPNCAASVVLTQLYVANGISFASLLSGLITNAGLGIVVLVRYGANRKQLLRVIGLLFAFASLSGVILQLIG